MGIFLKKHSIFLFAAGVLFVSAGSARAAVLDERISFNVDPGYDLSGRVQVSATLRALGQNIYFYVEDDYWNGLDGTNKNGLRERLEDLAGEFDQVIYPKERAVFGSEWSPGIDNDARVTVLITQLAGNAGGYFNMLDEYPRVQAPASNEREMIYLNTGFAFSGKFKSLLAHEFQHLITFYQKNKLYGVEEDVWLNEARSEYAPTLLGYDNDFRSSYLSERVGVFLDNSSDSLTEWRNKTTDYGAVSMFVHYLADRFGVDILRRMSLSNQTGIASIEAALKEMGRSETFSDVFADWTVANFLNDCSAEPVGEYCYRDTNLSYQRLHVDYTMSYSGFPNLVISRSGSMKDWTPVWYRFRQGAALATDRDTLKVEFSSIDARAEFRVPYVIIDQNNRATVHTLFLRDQAGVIYVPDFSSQNKTVLLMPFNQFSRNGFGQNDPAAAFNFTATSISGSLPVLNAVSPAQGGIDGGFEVTLQGGNLLQVAKVFFDGVEVSQFEILGDELMRFIVPSHSAGQVDVKLVTTDGEQVTFDDMFQYQNVNGSVVYADGSLLRARGDHKVYIMNGRYKRWVQSAEIFNHYGHLRWEDIIEVESSVLAEYTDSWLIRADGDSRVWEVNGDGTKHWLNMTAEQFSVSGRLWDMVYIVNNFERDFYRTGAAVMFR